MNCPSCAYQSPYSAMRCPQCRTVFETEAVETLGHLVYLRDRLERWRAEGLLDPAEAAEVLAVAEQEIRELARRLASAPVGLAVSTVPAELAAVPATPPLLEPSTAEAGAAASNGAVTVEDDQDAAAAPAVAAAGLAEEPADAAVAAGPVPVAAAPGPSFAWRDVGTYLLSERTLHGLLGLGAFLILASGVVISTLNPTGLGPIEHLAAVVATTLLFFAAGYVVRQRLRLTIAGATLLGIAGAFVPLTIWTLGQRRILDWETGAIWLAASLMSLPLYLTAQRILRDRTFAVLAAIAGGSELLAVLNWLGVALEWGLAALVLLATGYLRLASRLDGTSGLGWALAWCARLATPLLMLALLFARLGSDVWATTFGRPLGSGSEYAIGVGWWLGVLFFILGVRLHHRRRDLYAAAWTVPVAYVLTLTRLPSEAGWYNAALAVLAIGYLLEGYRRGERSPTYGVLARDPFFQLAVVLAAVAVAWPLQIADSRIATLYLLAGFFVASTLLLGLRAPGWVGLALLVTTYGMHLERAELAADARPLAWAILTAVLLAAGELAVRRSGEGDRPLLATIFARATDGRPWRSLLGAPLFAVGYAVSLIALIVALGVYGQAPAVGGARQLVTVPILGFTVLLATLAASSVARRTGFFLYFVAWLALIPITATAANVRDWLGREPYAPDVSKLLAGVSVAYLTIAWLADRRDGRYARPLYLAGYLLLPIAMLISALDRMVALQVVGFSGLVYVASAWLVHIGRLPSFEALVQRLCGAETSTSARTVRTLWVYLAVWLLPLWAIILTGIWQPPIVWYALVLSGFALGYPAVGLWIMRVRPEYRWPWYLGGYGLSAMAPLVALTDTTFRPVVLGLSVGLYVASAVVGRRSGWLYPVAVLLPVVLWQALGSLALFERWYGFGLIGLGLAYGPIGLSLQPIGRESAKDGDTPDAPDGRWLIRGRIGAYALPFFVAGYALTALGLARAANQEHEIATLAFGLAAGQFAASTVVFRQPLFGAVTAALVTVAYVVGLTLTPLEASQRGLGLLPGGLLMLLVGEGLRRIAKPHRLAGGATVTVWSGPWLVVACAAAVTAPLFSYGHEQRTWTLAWWGSTALFAALTALLRHPGGLFPTLVFGTVAYLATGYLIEPTMSSATSYATLAALTWAFLVAARVLERRRPAPLGGLEYVTAWVRTRMDPDRLSSVDSRQIVEEARGSTVSWTLPLHLAGWATLALACLGSIERAEAGLAATAALAVLMAGLAVLDGAVAYVWPSLAVGALALMHGLRLAGIPFDRQPPAWAGASLAAVLAGLLLRRINRPRVSLWVQPLAWTSLAFAAGATLVAATVQASRPGREGVQMLSLTIALAGLATIGHAFWRRDRHLTYAGVGLLEVGLFLELFFFDVGQPQAFALPGGAYLLMVAYLEWRRGTTGPVKRLLETAALVLLLGVSLIQAVGFWGDGHQRYVYDTLLLLESAGILALGAVLRWRYTFGAGAFALVADVLILLSDPLKALNTWYLVALIGLVLIGGVIWIERQRQQIPLWLEGWRARLEEWD